MRATVRIDDDVLAAARDLACQLQSSLGDVISDLVRQTLSRPAAEGLQADLEQRSEMPQLPVKASAGVLDLELVNQLCNEES